METTNIEGLPGTEVQMEPTVKESSSLPTSPTNPEPNPDWSLLFVGRIFNPTGYGIADGVMKLHICARDGEVLNAPLVPGNAPFTVYLKVNNQLVRTVTGIPACENYENMNQDPEKGEVCEYNAIITGLPAGVYSIVIEDSLLPVPNDVRGFSCFNAVQPPFATLNGKVYPNNSETTVEFEFGLTQDLGRIAQFGTVNGADPVECSLELKSKVEGSSDPDEFLEPGKTYYYRIVARNEFGESFGEILNFETPTYASAPVAETLPATNIH